MGRRKRPALELPARQALGPFSSDLGRHLAPFDTRHLAHYRFDLVVVGSGCAGASVALHAAERGASVAVVAKAELDETNTRYAQGGVAAVMGPGDSVEEHVQDTLRVGCDLSHPDVVESIVGGGPAAIADLISRGATFDRLADGGLDLSREGGHSHPRIIHAHGAATGLELQSVLFGAVRAHPNIARFDDTFAIDLLRDSDSSTAAIETGSQIVGLIARRGRDQDVVFRAREVVLATGGAGQIYRETTNPRIATGDGVAIAFRAGAELRDLEFFQFHPTCLYIAGAARVLISETVRGAGGVLRDRHGVRFMPEYHPKAELAPRDVVSRACFERMVATKDTNVYLDLSEVARDPHELFPGISEICGFFGIDIARDPIPVRPGAHYMIGGVRTDGDGRTSLPGLWAVWECASAGLHGANRMGSNSLLEGLVMGARVGELCALDVEHEPQPIFAPAITGRAKPRASHVQLGIEDMTYSLKSLMWRQMGIERSAAALEDALSRVLFWTRAVRDLARPTRKAFELLNMLTLAQLATRCALARNESRGVHYRSDFPRRDEAWRAHTLIRPSATRDGCLGAILERVPLVETVPQPTR